MAKVELGLSMAQENNLWRYMSLDKLIHLLETRTLFFTPLSYFSKTDPFEGYVPKVAFKALSDVFGVSHKELLKVSEDVKLHINKKKLIGIRNPNVNKMTVELDKKMVETPIFIRNVYKKLIEYILINCWHSNHDESEAMWKLYSDNGKGIAVKTSVKSLYDAISSIKEDKNVHVGRVKYLDFYDEKILVKECAVDGHLVPLLKRKSFEHENEVRLFINVGKPPFNAETKSETIKIDRDILIEQIYISPYATEPFISSTISICKKYGVEDSKIKVSQLLKGQEDLVNILGSW